MTSGLPDQKKQNKREGEKRGKQKRRSLDSGTKRRGE
jgi:hypothetical protein